ncbi:hypothetical protein NQ317_008301, partial [Molorchus minor]
MRRVHSQNSPSTSNQSHRSHNAIKHYGVKLPTIELPNVSGAYEKWLEFRDLYVSLIHNCESIEPIQKFHYLRASLEGPAAQCIKYLEFSATKYDVAW